MRVSIIYIEGKQLYRDIKLKNIYKWIFPQNKLSEEQFSAVRKETGSEITARLLVNRGVTSAEEVREFLDIENVKISSPFVFPDMGKAVNRINKAIKSKEHIVIFGDFDADGVTSTTLLFKTLKLLEANVSFYLPDRIAEGHGLNNANVVKLISSRQAKLIITVDCGISNISEIKLAASFGTDVIITDHHEPQEILPAAHAIINPKALLPEQKPKYLECLAGVGVAYKLACALLDANNKMHLHDDIFYYAALGTVGDVVPLLGENRAIVHKGMELISLKKPAAIGKILEIGGYKSSKKITAGTVAFGIVPKINAVGRLGDASPMVEFLMSEDEEKLSAYIEELNQSNIKRQEMCEETFLQAEQKIREEINLDEAKGIVLADPNWHPGIIGIVASKLVEKYYRPVFLVSINEEKNEARGSARSVDCLNLFDTLSEHADIFIQFGGHALAAGFSFDLNKISFQKFREKLDLTINKNINSEKLSPEIKIDMEISPEDLTANFVKELERLEPFGEANPNPVFCMTGLTLIQKKTMGAKKNHLKLFLSDDEGKTMEAVWWRKESLNIGEKEKLNIAFTPAVNNFMDKTVIQLIVKDIKPFVENEEFYKEKIIEEEGVEEEFFEQELGEIEEIKTECEKTLEEEIVESPQTIKGMPEFEWKDFRGATGFKKEFADYLSSKKQSLVFFAETLRAKEVLTRIGGFDDNLISRFDAKNADTIVFLDAPPDEKTFSEILNKTEAKEICIFFLKTEINSVETVKKLSSMLKYAHNNKNGEVNIEHVASLLGISSEGLLACVELLDNAEVIEVFEINEEDLKFSFARSKELNFIIELPEFQDFEAALSETEAYKENLRSADIAVLIKQFTGNFANIV